MHRQPRTVHLEEVPWLSSLTGLHAPSTRLASDAL
jgi:hypothetical protein